VVAPPGGGALTQGVFAAQSDPEATVQDRRPLFLSRRLLGPDT
jgi:hypothetical protein